MRYNRTFFKPEDRVKEKNKRGEVEKEDVEEEIAAIRNRKDYASYTREVEFGAVWGKACFELGDMLLEGKPGHEQLKEDVENVLKRYFIELKETFRLYGMSASEMVTAEAGLSISFFCSSIHSLDLRLTYARVFYADHESKTGELKAYTDDAGVNAEFPAARGCVTRTRAPTPWDPPSTCASCRRLASPGVRCPCLTPTSCSFEPIRATDSR